MLHSEGHRPGLIQRRGPVPVLHRLRRREVTAQPAVQLAVPVLGLLVDEHAGRGRCERPVVDGAGQRRPRRRALEAELGAEPRDVVAVGGVVALVPHVPDVHGAVGRIVGVPCGRHRVRAARAVGARWVELGDDFGQHLGVVNPAPRSVTERGLPVPVLVAPDVLVAAVPQGQARVRAEPRHGLPGLGDHLAAQGLLFGVRGAGEQEVLPHQQTQLVAEVVEIVAFIDPAAPDADQVDIGVAGLTQPGGVPAGVDARQEHVVGNPVDPAGEDRDTVHPEREGGAVLVGGRVELDGAEPDAPAPAVQPSRRARQRHLDRVQPLVPVAVRPPQLGVGDRHVDDHAGLPGRQGRGHALTAEPHLDRQRAVRTRRPLNLDVRAQPTDGAVDLGQRPHRRDPRPGPGLQRQGPPDAGRHQVRAPVPTEVSGHLADRVERVGVDVRAGTQFPAHPLGRRHAGGEGDGELVAAGPQPGTHGDPVRAMHVLRRGDELAVQPDRRDRVQPEDDQVDLVVGAGRPLEGRLVPPVHPADPRHRRLVAVQVRIGDEPGGQQVQVDAARHRGRDGPALKAGGDVPADRPHGPSMVQRDVHESCLRVGGTPRYGVGRPGRRCLSSCRPSAGRGR